MDIWQFFSSHTAPYLLSMYLSLSLLHTVIYIFDYPSCSLYVPEYTSSAFLFSSKPPTCLLVYILVSPTAFLVFRYVF